MLSHINIIYRKMGALKELGHPDREVRGGLDPAILWEMHQTFS